MSDVEQAVRSRLKWVRLYQSCGDAGLVCRRCGIARPTVRKWWRRFQADGEAGLHEHSRRPLKVPSAKVTADYEKLILQFRRERNLGAKRIQAELLRHHNWRVSTATIWKVLARHQVPPLRRHRTPQVPVRYSRPVPGERVQVDTTNIAPGIYQYTAVDDCTRFRVIGIYSRRTARSVAFRVDRIMGEESLMRGTKPAREAQEFSKGRLTARPRQVKNAAPSGLQQLKLEGKRDGFIYVPAGYSADRPAPLMLMLHGAGGNARHSIPLLQHLADRTGLILLVPDSREQTWDVIMGGYGPDVAYIDRALEQTFGRYNVDPARMAIGGFSDGASYALSLGATNGDLFTHVIAFSPGFMAPASEHGSPALFISHGTRDRVLPIEACSRKIVPRVKRAGYRVRYREFNGPHTVPTEIAGEAMDWFIKDAGSDS